jgi:DNA-binding GntR family transcriptional regulator
VTPPGTFERVYGAIKLRLREGAYKPGERLDPGALSHELNASVTPVRDALHRLTGERLVEAQRQGGFRVPMVSEAILRQLYAWHLDLLLLALAKQRALGIDADERVKDNVDANSSYQRQDAMFLKLARAAGNLEYVFALKAASERLEPIRRLEERFLDAVEKETDEITSAIQSGNLKALRRSLVKYHRRRERIVPDLLAMAQLN